MIRFARFQGEVAERAEEYQVYVDESGRVFRVGHDLPEARPGKNLTETEARSLAESAVHEPLSDFAEVSAEANKRPARTDWTFVLKDTRDYGLPEGEPRISIEIAGDEVADSARYVYIPEEWSRNERAKQTIPSIVTVVCTIMIMSVVVAGAVVGAIHWSRKRPFSARLFFGVFAAVFVVGAVSVINSWPVLASRASTAQPLELQAGTTIAASLVFGIFSAAGLGLVAGLVAANRKSSWRWPLRRSILLGVSAGLAMAGAGALARHAGPSTSPLWGNLGPASTFMPLLGAALAPLGTFFTDRHSLHYRIPARSQASSGRYLDSCWPRPGRRRFNRNDSLLAHSGRHHGTRPTACVQACLPASA